MPRLIDAFTQFLDDNGDPLVNGLLKFVESGTNNTDKDTFADINETIKNTNPVVLDGAGRCPNVFGTGSYNVISYTSASVQIQQFDPVSGDTLEGAFSAWNAITIYGEGDLVTGSDGLYYRSIAPGNQSQDPIATPGQWEEVKFVGVWNNDVTYDSGDSVYGSDGILYLSLINSNLGNDPTTDDTNWRSYLFNTSPNIFDNVGFTSTIDAKALTFDLKTKGLTDPSSLDTVKIAFRSETLTTGDYDIVDAITATSIIVPSGATLGFDAVEDGYVYLYAISNAGELELAIAKKAIFDESVVHSTTAINATADSDNILYSTTARANVPVRLLGRVRVVTGAVAGEWDNAPTELVVWSSNMKKTGDIIQTVRFDDGAVATGTTALPADDSIPQITEGDEFMTIISSPISSINKLAIEIGAQLGHSVDQADLVLALFQDAIADALTAGTTGISAGNGADRATISCEMIAGTTSAITFRFRAGYSSGTTTFNGAGGTRRLGGVANSYMRVTEIMQ